MFYSSLYNGDRWKMQLFSRDNSNCYLQIITIITVISQWGQKILQIDMTTYFCLWDFYKKKWEYTLFTKWYISHIIFYNLSYFVIWIAYHFLNRMHLKFVHNLIFTVILENMKSYHYMLCRNNFLFCTWVEENKIYIKFLGNNN